MDTTEIKWPSNIYDLALSRRNFFSSGLEWVSLEQVHSNSDKWLEVPLAKLKKKIYCDLIVGPFLSSLFIHGFLGQVWKLSKGPSFSIKMAKVPRARVYIYFIFLYLTIVFYLSLHWPDATFENVKIFQDPRGILVNKPPSRVYIAQTIVTTLPSLLSFTINSTHLDLAG